MYEGIEAARDRIFESAATDERAHFERRVVSGIVRADHAELERAERGPVGLECKHLARGTEHHRAPARAVVDPLVLDDIGWFQAERFDDPRQHLGLERTGA